MRIIVASLLCVATLSAVITLTPQATPHSLCYIFSEQGACSSCVLGYKLQDGVCVEGMRNCKTYDTANGLCLTCYRGYTLTAESACQVNPQADLMEGCSRQYEDTCLECKKGYYFNYDNVCEPIDPLCQVFDYKTKSCEQCQFGYIWRANEGGCIKVDGTRFWQPHCLAYDSNAQCLKCHNGYFHVGTCIPSNPSCRTHHPQDPRKCTSCFNSFTLVGDRCMGTQENHLCKTFDKEGKCQECMFRTVKNAGGICIAVDPVCKTANINGECLTCSPGYTISGTTCVPRELKTVNPLCGAWSGNNCLACQGWTHVNAEGLCSPISNTCKVYNTYTGECYMCHNGWMDNYRGACVPEFDKPLPDAPNRPDGRTAACEVWGDYDPKLGKCVIEDIPCLQADENGRCKKCLLGHYLDEPTGKCEAYHPYCKDFDIVTKKCKECYEAFIFEGETCVRKPRKQIQ